MSFDVKKFAAGFKVHDRYKRHMARIGALIRTDSIKATVEAAIANVKRGVRSFVIYGEPQSGKTEMMIALTAGLMDAGKRIIFVLVNDNVQLLGQNLERFRRSKLDPAPRHYNEVLEDEITLEHGEWIIFCKKNPNDLRKMIDKLDGVTDSVVVIDDEADYATPNGRVNKVGERTKINKLVNELLGSNGFYIGVTATPARLNLNNTYDNRAEHWVLFEPHSEYVGHKTFFPIRANQDLGFILTKLPDTHDLRSHLREALFRFMVNVAYLNSVANAHSEEKNYCMLVHTSGIRADHSVDHKNVLQILRVLGKPDPENVVFQRYSKRLYEIAKERYPESADAIMMYIAQNINRNVVVVMNSSPNKAGVDYSPATSPTAPFTIAIGGNIVSRGVTFDNLLSMFFTRDVKHRIQQDTYIQRARMFGSRKPYLEYFELCIPETLYNDWHRCFVYHNLALESIRSKNISPVWVEDKRIAAVSGSSIDRTTVNMDYGEMSFELFDYSASVEAEIEKICNGSLKGAPERLRALQKVVGSGALPDYLLSFVESFMVGGDKSVALHKPALTTMKDANLDTLERRKGFMGASVTTQAAPDALHHIKVFHNGKGRARVFYKFSNKVKFLQNQNGRGTSRGD